MNRLVIGLVLGCAVLRGQGVLAEEKSPLEATPLANMKAELPRLIKIIEKFGHGDLESALDLVEAELPEPFAKAGGPFEQDLRAHWRQGFRSLTDLNPTFDSVELIGYHPLSSAARTLVLIGHGFRGPIQFRIRMFRYQGQWKITNLSFRGDWEEIESDTRFTRLERPIIYPLDIHDAE